MYIAAAALLLLAATAGGERILSYNVGGESLGKFCGDPGAFLVNRKASVARIDALSVGKLGALGTYRTLVDGYDDFEFIFPVPPGNYTVILGFAELWAPAFSVGKRTFGIDVQGEVHAEGFDIFRGVGRARPLWRTLRGVQVYADGLHVKLLKGDTNKPVISVIELFRDDGEFLNYPVGSDCDEAPAMCAADDPDDKEDHQAHAVAGEGYVKTDFNGDGKVSVLLDGSKSHSHYFDSKSGVSGAIMSYNWTYKGQVIGTKAKVDYDFPVGKSIVTLTVTDNAGDVSCENTEVIGQAATDNGAYCYFYPGITSLKQWLNSNPKPMQGVLVRNINWPNVNAFPFIGKSGKVWTVRCITYLYVGDIAPRSLQIERDGRVALYAHYKPIIAEGGVQGGGMGGDGIVTVKRGFRAGMIHLNIVYHKLNRDAKLVLLLDDEPVPQEQLRFLKKGIIPVLKNIDPNRASFLGGGKMQLFGSGFFNKPEVIIGRAKAKVTVVNPGELLIDIPSQAKVGSKHPLVFVRNRAGESNGIHMKYTLQPEIRWTKTYLKRKDGKKLELSLLTSIAVGPDFKYYMGTQSGFVWKVSVNKRLIVLRKCRSFSMGKSRSVLGVAFNPWRKRPQPYITTSTLFRNVEKHNTPLRHKVDGWANGKVQALVVGCRCFCKVKDVVTGLPVSNKDHSVNKMVFLPNGDMLLTVAGSTNAGHNTPNNQLGGQPESPLSASVLLIKTSKGDEIDAHIRYNHYKWPATAKKVGADDVEVYASGLRNSFGICRTVDGKIYATDNAGNLGYGYESTSCSTQRPFKRRAKDELNLIVKGGFYGHANRNQGNCVWGRGRKPIASFLPSTNGLVQYQSNAFYGSLKFDLIATEFATGNVDVEGGAIRITRKRDGTVKKMYKMAEYSGLDAVNGLHGEIVMPRVARKMIAVLQPDYVAPPGVPFVVSVTPKIGTGKQLILVSGNNFKRGLKAFVGGRPCAGVREVRQFSFKCVTPSGKGLVSVTVVNPDGRKSPWIKPAGDFSFL